VKVPAMRCDNLTAKLTETRARAAALAAQHLARGWAQHYQRCMGMVDVCDRLLLVVASPDLLVEITAP
jgi:hypothetical protein